MKTDSGDAREIGSVMEGEENKSSIGAGITQTSGTPRRATM